jgi:hypothetical protein
MGTFAPEFSQYWMTVRGTPGEGAGVDARDDERRAQQAALEELAERVNAARSVV